MILVDFVAPVGSYGFLWWFGVKKIGFTIFYAIISFIKFYGNDNVNEVIFTNYDFNKKESFRKSEISVVRSYPN